MRKIKRRFKSLRAELTEALYLLRLFGHPIPKDFVTFSPSELTDIQESMLELMEEYSKKNTSQDFVGAMIALCEMFMFMNTIIIRHGAVDVFSEIRTAVTNDLRDKYIVSKNSTHITMRTKNGDFMTPEQWGEFVGVLENNPPPREMTLKQEVDEIIVTHRIFNPKS